MRPPGTVPDTREIALPSGTRIPFPLTATLVANSALRDIVEEPSEAVERRMLGSTVVERIKSQVGSGEPK
jgi:hypothetical protein